MMPNESVRIEVELDSKQARITNSDGITPIEQIEVWAAKEDAFIDVVDNEGKSLYGGLELSTEKMDEIARKWLKARGLSLEDEI
jgi:hypothetical protein